MSTPPNGLNLDGLLEGAASPRPKGARRREGLDLSGVLETAAPASSRPAARPRHPYAADDFLLDGDWSPARVDEVKSWFKQTYGRDLPHRFGQTATHNRMGLDHSSNMDVQVNPQSAEGRALASFLRESRIPFLAYNKAKAGAATGPHFHVGRPSHGLGSQPEAPTLNLDGAPEPLSLDGILEPNIAADFREASDLERQQHVDGDGPVERVDSYISYLRRAGETEPYAYTTNAHPSVSAAGLPPLPAPTAAPTPTAARLRRDVTAAVESSPTGREWVDVRLPEGVRDWSELKSNEVVKVGFRQWAEGRGIPREFVEEWLKKNGGGLHIYDLATKKALTMGEAMGREDIYDTNRRTFRLSAEMPKLKQLERDYDVSLGVVSRTVKHLEEAGRYSAGEHALGVLGEIPGAASFALTPISRPVEAAQAYVWSKADKLTRPGLGGKLAALGNPFDPQAIGDAYKTLKGERPENARNFIAQDIERDMSRLHPTIGKAYGVLAELVFDPVNLLGAAGALKYANRFNKVTEAARVASAAGDVDRLESAAAAAGRVADEAAAAVGTSADAARLNYARERAAHYAQEAATAQSPGARRVARELADDYAQEAAGLESGASPLPGPDDIPVSISAAPLPAGASASRPGLLRRAGRAVSDVLQLPKAKAGLDLSAPMRQGLPQVAAHPSYMRRAYVEQVKAFASEDHFNAFVESIRARPDFQQMQDSGLYLSHVGAGPEEVFTSGLAQRIPGVAASDRAYSAALDSIRLSAWDNYTSSLPAHLRDNSEMLKAVAELVNVSTGRGVVPILDRFAAGRKLVELANIPFWSPRNMAGKFNVLSPVRVVRNMVDPATRPVAWLQARDAFRGLTMAGTTLGLAHLAGLDAGLNPFKPDFGKVRLGDKVVVDLTGGEGFTVRYLAQMAQSFADIEAGRTPKKTPAELTGHYLRSQLQPSAAVGVDFTTGERFGSTKQNPKPFTYGEAAADLTVPFVVESVYDGWVASGGSTLGEIDESGSRGDFLRGDFSKVKAGFKYTPASLLSVLGLGVGFYEKPKDYAAAAERAKIQPGGAAGEELKRFGVVLGDLPKGQRVRVADNFKFEGLTGDSVGFTGQHVGQTPEDLQHFRDELTSELEKNIAAEMLKPDYQKLDRGKQRAYLLHVVKATHSTVQSRFLRDARGREVETLEDFERYQKELEGRGPGLKPGQTLRLGGPGTSMRPGEDGGAAVRPLMSFDGG